jgi:ComF family protein
MLNIIRTFLSRQLINPVVDVFFPPICYICESSLLPDQKIICQDCWLKIPEFKGQIDQSLSKRSFDRLFILFEFDETIRRLIHLLKYKRHLTLASYFAIKASTRFELCHQSPYDEIIPVPLHRTRKRERGYNQSEEIAIELGRIMNIPVKSEHLMRIRFTSTQTKMSREEREKNVCNAFQCQQDLNGYCILLVDDVITTGNTIDVCVKTLRKAGAKKVDVLVIAHPPMKD